MSFLRHGKKGGFTTEAQRHRGRKRFTAKGAKVAKSSQRSAISIRPATFGAAWLVDALTHVDQFVALQRRGVGNLRMAGPAKAVLVY
jgi:hypothetical protein